MATILLSNREMHVSRGAGYRIGAAARREVRDTSVWHRHRGGVFGEDMH